jgi:hypothetical protein
LNRRPPRERPARRVGVERHARQHPVRGARPSRELTAMRVMVAYRSTVRRARPPPPNIPVGESPSFGTVPRRSLGARDRRIWTATHEPRPGSDRQIARAASVVPTVTYAARESGRRTSDMATSAQ